MATSGTTAFDMDFTEIAEEAWERAGREMRSGYDLRTARRSMNLMTIEWQNRGINMWTIDEGTLALTEGTSEYTLPADTIDLLEQQGTVIDPMQLQEQSTQANIATILNMQGQPVQA